MRTWFPVLENFWNPDLVDKGTEPYIRFLLHRVGELLHFKTESPWSLPILSTIYLMAYLRRKDWWEGNDNPSEVLHKIEPLLQELRSRLEEGVWLERRWPKETAALLNELREHASPLAEMAYWKQSARKRHQSEIQRRILAIHSHLHEFNKVADLPKYHNDDLSEEPIYHEMDVLVELIYDQHVEHQEKLTLINNYATDLIRDLLHYGHSMDHLLDIWLEDTVIKPDIEEDGASRQLYIDKFADLGNNGLLEGDKEFTTLHRVSTYKGKIDTHLISLKPDFPHKYTLYDNFEQARYRHEHHPNGPRRCIDDFTWIQQTEKAKDPIAAAISSAQYLINYKGVLNQLDRRRTGSLSFGLTPFVADEAKQHIYLCHTRRLPDLGWFPSATRLYKYQQEWDISNTSYKGETVKFLMRIFEWLTQAEYFRIGPKAPLQAGTAHFVGLWTAFQHIFSKTEEGKRKLDWRYFVPAYTALTFPRMEATQYSKLLRYFDKRRLLENKTPEVELLCTYNIYKTNLAKIIQICKELCSRTPEVLSQESLLEDRLLSLGATHPASTKTSEDGTFTKRSLASKLERLEKRTLSDLVLLNESRNSLIHEIDSNFNDNELHIMTKTLSYYISVILDRFIETFYVLKDQYPDRVHRDVWGIYREMKKQAEENTLSTNPRLFTIPHRIVIKKGPKGS